MEALDIACANYVAGDFMRELQRTCPRRLGEASDWELSIDPNDRYGHTLLFRYPVSSPIGVRTYIRDRVKIELGWRSATAPQEQRTFRSYIAERFTGLLRSPEVRCTVLLPLRTFWEKVTALHAESFREEVPHFFSRHYSDVATMYQAGIIADIPLNFAMLDKVRRYKKRYYPSAWAHYELAVPGKLVVVPGASKLRALEGDYRDMRMMFFDTPPRFDEVVSHLREFEERVNS